MNLIVFGPSDCGGCAKYRFWTPYGALAAAYPEEYAIVAATSGNQDVNTAYPEYEVHPEWLTSDLIVFQRVVTPRALAAMKRLRSMAPKVRIAYEIDDNLRSLPALNPLVGIFGNCRPATKIAEEAMRLADIVIVSTAPLAKLYANLNPRIVVAKNALADEDFAKYARPIESARKRLGQFRIGYAGTASHAGDVALVARSITKFMLARADVRLFLFGQDLRGFFPRELWGRIEVCLSVGSTPKQMRNPSMYRDAVMPNFYETLGQLDFDLAIAPLESHVFNAGKSTIKLLEYGQAGYPVLASRYGPYAEYAVESYGAIASASDEREWQARLEQLYENEPMRRQLAERNRTFIGENYLISKRLDEWKAAIDAGLLEPALSI